MSHGSPMKYPFSVNRYENNSSSFEKKGMRIGDIGKG
jgi:hypothetical protein